MDIKLSKRKVVNFRGQNKVVGGLTDKDKIAILLYISREFANVDKEEDLFSKVISLCAEIFESDNTTVRIWDGEYLVPVRFQIETEPPRRNLKPEEGYSGYAFRSRKPLLLEDLSAHPEYLDEREKTRSVMVVPLIQKEEVLGTVSIEKNMEFFYINDDLELLEALGNQLGLALSGVRLIEGLITARAREAAVLSQLEWDMKMGRNVQSQILPKQLHPWNGLHFSSYYEPMAEVSGDYFDVVKQGNSLTAINVDVSGHGIPAALVTMVIHHHFIRCVNLGLGLAEIMEELGVSLKSQLPESTYFTAFIVRIFSDNTFSYVNGGHQKMIHFKTNEKKILELDTEGVPLGILDVKKRDYEEKQSRLEPGDILMLLTDGFVEQRNSEKEEAGIGRVHTWLLDGIESVADVDQKEIVEKIGTAFAREFKKFQGQTPNGDDLSFLMMYMNPEISEAKKLLEVAKEHNTKGRKEDAFGYSKKAYRIEPSYKENLLFLGKMYFQINEYADSAKYFDEYIQTSGEKTAHIYFSLGRAHYMNGNIPDSKRALKVSLSIDPTFAKSSLLLARCYLKENAKPKAIKTLQQSHKNIPGNENIKLSLQKLQGTKA